MNKQKLCEQQTLPHQTVLFIIGLSNPILVLQCYKLIKITNLQNTIVIFSINSQSDKQSNITR